MGVTFDAAARRAIDRAMQDAERRSHSTLLPAHLVYALLTDVEAGGIADRLGDAGAPLARAWGAALDQMPGSVAATAAVSPAVEDLLDRASLIAQRSGAGVVGAGDMLEAFAEGDPSLAAAIRSSSLRPQDRPGAHPSSTASPVAWRGGCRVGMGYDSHRFEPGGPLILGGVRLPSDVRLVGHSDADAVAHAVADAILGAAAVGDIGELFPDDDPVNSGRNSLEMLQEVVTRIARHGWVVEAVDITVIAERPRIGAHRAAMKSALGAALALPPACVGIKGKTNEGMGWIGRGEGLACIAVATVGPKRPGT
ncbi:MAG: hypothetical protein NVS4B3_02810 [Gemmatimonadaceae bacterium]